MVTFMCLVEMTRCVHIVDLQPPDIVDQARAVVIFEHPSLSDADASKPLLLL